MQFHEYDEQSWKNSPKIKSINQHGYTKEEIPEADVNSLTFQAEAARQATILMAEDTIETILQTTATIVNTVENTAENILESITNTSEESKKLPNTKNIRNRDIIFEILKGMKYAIVGSLSVLRNPNLRSTYTKFLKVYGTILLYLYGLSMIFGILVFPIISVIAVYAPTLLLNFFSLVTLWAHSVACKFSPSIPINLFVEELQTISPQKANQISNSIERKEYESRWLEATKDEIDKSWYFMWRYFLIVIACLVPFFGSFLSYFGNIWLVSQSLAWSLFTVYTSNYKRMNFQQTKSWINQNKWVLMGFALPFTFVSSIPILGPLFIGIAQASAAHLYNDVLSKDEVEEIQSPVH